MSHLATGDDVAAGAELLKAGLGNLCSLTVGTLQILSSIPNRRVLLS